MLVEELMNILSQRNEINDKIANQYLIQLLFNKYNNYDQIYKLVFRLSHMKGDLELKTDDDNIKASLFWIAVFINDISLVKLLLDRGGDDNDFINKRGTFKEKNLINVTPLYVACSNSDNFDIIMTLLNNGANVNITSSNEGSTPLMALAANRYVKPYDAINIATLLIWYGADINFHDKNKNTTALHLAIDSGENILARYLISRGANPFENNLNAVISFIFQVAERKENDFNFKKKCLDLFLYELRKSEYFKEEYMEIIYKLFGAFYNPIILQQKKYFWKTSLNHKVKPPQKRRRVDNEKFLKIVGGNYKEFQTLSDLELIETKIDCLIQSILISQRIVGGNDFTLALLRQLCLEYEKENEQEKCRLLKTLEGYYQ